MILEFLLKRKFKKINNEIWKTYADMYRIMEIFQSTDPIESIKFEQAIVISSILRGMIDRVKKLIKKYKYSFNVSCESFETYSFRKLEYFLETVNNNIVISSIINGMVQVYNAEGALVTDEMVYIKVQNIFEAINYITYEIRLFNEKMKESNPKSAIEVETPTI